MLLRTARKFPHRRHLAQHLLAAFAQVRVHASRERAGEVVGERPDVLGNRHVIVVQNDQEIRRQGAGMVERFKCHARGQRSIADDCNHRAVLPGVRGRHRHAQSCTHRGTRVPYPKGVVFAFAARRKRRKAAVLLDRVQTLAPPGQYLVRVGLMPHVPNEAVKRRVEHIVERDGEFNRAETGGKMTAAGTDAMDQKLPQLAGQHRKLGGRYPSQVSRTVDGFEQRILLGRVGHRQQSTLRRGGAGNRCGTWQMRAQATSWCAAPRRMR
jgi:hypothetical protein